VNLNIIRIQFKYHLSVANFKDFSPVDQRINFFQFSREFSILGLFLIALGTGGIKPCVSAFGGDQFILPQQERQLAMFFSLFYFAINTGSLISTVLTPVIRDTKCFENDCYFVAFLVPAILMILSISKDKKHISVTYIDAVFFY